MPNKPDRPLPDRVRHLRLVAPLAPQINTHLQAIERMVSRAEHTLAHGRAPQAKQAA